MTEMQKLFTLCWQEGIPCEVGLMPAYLGGTLQFIYPSKKNRKMDAVCHCHSYGGDDGLLEIYGICVENPYDEVEGWLTADEVFRRLKAYHKAHSTE